ncbi:MAG TPA: T9SS type A sorting domain-containing protein, partial [Bacteroidales bacterium]|nr:T9SS type A sorting domain-containing protein [Bacteroidales bacterium]
VSWTETGSAGIWNIIYGPAGFDPLSSGTLVEGLTQPTYTITGLSPTTQYSVYVQADCGDGDISNWSVVSNFTSACGIINEFTWVEEFNVWSLITQCWGLTGGTQTVSQYLGNAVRANFWSWTSGNNAYLKSPLIDKSSLENPRLEFFWSHLYSSSYPNDRLVVEISDDNGVSWTNVWELSGPLFNSNDGAGNTMPGTYTTSGQINLSSFDDIIQFRFNFISGYGPDVFIDKVTIFDIVCNAPVDLAVSDVTTSSATITWVDESGTADVDLIYGTTGFDPLSQGTIITNVSSPYLLTGLDEGSSYDVYVRSNCDGDITSDWTGPVNFTTEITPLNDETDILTYSFGSLDAETAVIDPVAKTVYVLVIAGTDLSNLVANFSLSNGASAKVGSVDQVSGETSNNFSLGSVVYTVTAEDGVTTTDWTVTVEVWIGIRNSDNFGLSVLPNPNNGQFILQLNHNSDNCVCELTDVTGRTILSKKLSGNGSISEYFDVNLAPGSYYLKVISGDKVITEKLIIE